MDKLADMQAVLDECHRLLPPVPGENVWLPYLGDTLDAGMATLFAFEIIEACKYLIGPNPVNGIWLGAASDVIIRERGIEFVDGSAPGFAAIVGAAPTIEDAVRIARELQEKNLYVFMAGHTHGDSFAEQLAEAGVEMGWETRLVPFGKEISAAIYALGFANRVALSFGGVKPGDYARNLKYNKNRIFAFVMALGEVDGREVRGRGGRHQLRIPDHRRHRHSADSAYRHLHLRARRFQRSHRPHRGEVPGSPRLQDQSRQGADPGGVRRGLRRRAHPQGTDLRRIRRQQDAGLRILSPPSI